MNRKNRDTLSALFVEPAQKDLRFDDVARLLRALECELSEGSGSRVRWNRDGIKLGIHKPHKKELKAYQVREVREFLMKIGEEPERNEEDKG